MVHGIGLCDEWPMIRYPTDGGQREGSFEKNMTITVESYIGKVGGKEGVKLEPVSYTHLTLPTTPYV